MWNLLRSTPLREWQEGYTNYGECGLAIQWDANQCDCKDTTQIHPKKCEGKEEKCKRLQQ